MAYQNFEDLPVWKTAIDIKLAVDAICKTQPVRSLGNLIDQIDRSSLSVSNNIAEGFERGTTNELIYFLYVARGSAGETRSMLQYLQRRDDTVPLRSELSQLIELCRSVSRQLRGWLKSLQESDIKGQRHLTEDSRRAYQQANRAREFWRKNQEEVGRIHEQRLREEQRRREGQDRDDETRDLDSD